MQDRLGMTNLAKVDLPRRKLIY